MPLRRSSAGDSIEPHATTTAGAAAAPPRGPRRGPDGPARPPHRRRLDRDAAGGPVLVRDDRLDAGRPAVASQDPLRPTADHAAGTGVAGVLEPGLHRRAL